MTSGDLAVYKRILAALDGSRSAHRALEEALRLARASEATLMVATVPIIDSSRGITETNAIDEAAQKAAWQRLDHARQLCKLHKVPARIWVIDAHGASVPAAIMQAALTAGADLIAMGTHGHRIARQHLLGSVAETILRSSHVPVLMVRDNSSGDACEH